MSGGGVGPRALGGGPGPVGRDSELGMLDATLRAARDGVPSLTLVGGELGIGKTCLMLELEERARRDDMCVMAGACVALEAGEMPYASVAAGLGGVAQPTLHRALEDMWPAARAQLAYAFPTLAIDAPAAPPAIGDEPREQRFHEFLAELLEALSRRGGLVLILEDFQWADVATRDFVRVLAQRLRRQRLAAMITYRPEQTHLRRPEAAGGRGAGDTVSSVLADLRARAQHLALGGLDAGTLRVLLAGMGLGAPSADVIERASGNPLFARELFVASLGERDQAPGTVEELLRMRLNDLTAAARRLVVTAAVVARPAGQTLLAGAAGLAENEARAVVREVLECGVLIRSPGVDRDALSFRHDILRKLAYDDMPSHDRSERHRAVAEAMEARGTAQGAAELASHWALAGENGRAAVAWIRAAEESCRLYAFREAFAQYQRALRIADDMDGTEPWDRGEVACLAADVGRFAGLREPAIALAAAALADADRTRDRELCAVLHEVIGRCAAFDFAQAVGAFSAARDLLPAARARDRARILAAEARAHSAMGHWDAALALGAEALALTQDSGRIEEAHARTALGLALAFLGDPESGAEHFRTAGAIGRAAGDAEAELRAALYLGEALRLSGEFEGALSVMVEGTERAGQLGMESLFGHYLMLNAAQDWFQLGEWDLAHARLQAVEDRAPMEWNALMRDLVTAHLALGRGERAEARRATEAAAGLFAKRQPAEFAGEVYAVRAELALLLGEHERARALIQDGLKWAMSPGELLYAAPLFPLGARVEAELRVVAPQRAAPERAREMLGALDELLGASTGRPPPTAVAHRTTCFAERRRAEGEPDPAAWSRAASAWAALRMPFPAAYARVRQAEAALARDRDLAAARSLLSASAATAHRLGAAPLKALAATVAAQVGISLDEQGPTAPTQSLERAELDLTRRELEVLAFLARGCSNREISEELVLSPRTVETHVQRIFAKLDVHNRTAATLRAQELGLVGRPEAGVLRFV